MAIKIKYDPSVEEAVRLGYSAIAEACIALSALTFPEPGEGSPKPSEEHQRWREELSGLLPSSLLGQLIEFGTSDGDYWVLPTNFFDMASFRPYSLEIARVRALSASEICEVVVEEFRSTYEFTHECEIRALEAVERDPIAWRDRVVELLEAFRPYFQPIWAELEPSFANALERVERVRKTKSIYEWLPALDRRISWDPVRSQLITIGETEETLDFSPYSEFGVVPTYFGSHQIFFYSSRKQHKIGVLFAVPAARGERSSSSEANSKVPDALIDAGELAILEVLGKQPATTSELAEAVKISERTAASRLKKLEEAGLVKPVGDSNASRYRKWQADKERLRKTLHALELRLLGD